VKAAGDKVTRQSPAVHTGLHESGDNRVVKATRPKAKDQPRRVASQEVMRSGLAGKTGKHHMAKVMG